MTIINIICTSQNDEEDYPLAAFNVLENNTSDTEMVQMLYAVKSEGRIFMLFISEKDFEPSMIKTELSTVFPKETSIVISETRGDIDKPMLFGEFDVLS